MRAPLSSTEREQVQRRTVAVLSAAQVIGGIGTGASLSVGALLVRDVSGSSAWAGLAVTMLTFGAALGALPLSALAAERGRRAGLTTGWLTATAGAVLVMAGAQLQSTAVVLVGLLGCGVSSATNLQSRYAAADLAAPAGVGRALSLVVWSTTVGAVLGPNLTGPGSNVAGQVGLPPLGRSLRVRDGGVRGRGAGDGRGLAAGPVADSAGGVGCRRTRCRGGRGPRRWGPAKRRVSQAVTVVRGTPDAQTGIVIVGSAHAVMVSVMAMTPVHMRDHGSTLTLVGLTISLHIAGMYALSPVMGVLTDRWGWRRTTLLGQGLLLVAVLIAGTSGESESRITVGLVVLGLGWSASLIAGSALVTRSVPVSERASVQGLSDLAMNLAGALGGLAAGLIVSQLGFGVLNTVAAMLTLPVILRVITRGSSRRDDVTVVEPAS
ncbi:MAG: MFS transporter [Nocardioidaceae bacterium]